MRPGVVRITITAQNEQMGYEASITLEFKIITTSDAIELISGSFTYKNTGVVDFIEATMPNTVSFRLKDEYIGLVKVQNAQSYGVTFSEQDGIFTFTGDSEYEGQRMGTLDIHSDYVLAHCGVKIYSE